MPKDDLSFIVNGGKTFSGSILTNRSKNGAVSLLAASLLNKGTTTLHNVPKIEEVNRLLEVLSSIGVEAVWDD
ncbi:MAG TPA: UDP-N-acetylglucosamine 1-carboxyvinyltransferase, partial [Candidatus Paceibacterota bacterium]|nr:UDP-N-acetylglucosamine 1-carboxyvinyltransferase [Candidatus Paceibacterota bacterium]